MASFDFLNLLFHLKTLQQFVASSTNYMKENVTIWVLFGLGCDISVYIQLEARLRFALLLNIYFLDYVIIWPS